MPITIRHLGIVSRSVINLDNTFGVTCLLGNDILSLNITIGNIGNIILSWYFDVLKVVIIDFIKFWKWPVVF